MVILGLAILALVAWLFLKRTGLAATPAARRGVVTWAVLGVVAALALRAGIAAFGPLFAVAAMLALGSLVIWLRNRGGGGPGDDGPDEPPGPRPDPGPDHHLTLPQDRDVIDADAFDRARAEWETLTPGRAPDRG